MHKPGSTNTQRNNPQQHQAQQPAASSNQASLGGAGNLSSSAAAQQRAAAISQETIERTIHFSQSQAIVWQIKFILNSINSKKALNQAANELETLSSRFGKEFDKYLLRELIEQIDLKDPVKAQKDKNEPFKVQLINQELVRCSQRPEFLQYFGDIAQLSFNERLGDFMVELTKRLKLSLINQILISLSLVESCRDENQPEALKILKQKLLDYNHAGKPEALPDYALHRLLYLYSTHPDLSGDENRENIQQYLIDSSTPSTSKVGSHISLRGAIFQDLMFANTNVEDPSICLTKDGNGIDNLDKSYKMLEPWQLLVDLGHFSSYNYNYLLKTLEDFKDINEKTMARTILNLAIHHTGSDDPTTRIIQNTFEANKKGDSTILRKDVTDKKNQLTWSIDNLVRAFRELFSHLNWQKVFEALSELRDDVALDQKAFATFLQLTNKSKPQNLPYPLTLILGVQWASPLLQLSFIENSIQFYIEKKEKSIYFNKAGERGRQELIDELTGIKDKVSVEFLHVWLSVDLVERLLALSDTHHFQRVRQLFEAPLKQVPEYLLLTLSLCRPIVGGTLMMNELLSLLLPQFLGNHLNSILVLQALWKNNQALMIRAICELCRHDQRIMNLSRVLDITQEVKESLMPIVDCEDYYFAVNLAILAGKRDFLHYDVWLQRRIQDVGTPFIKALLKYIKEHILLPITDFIRKGEVQPSTQPVGRGAPIQEPQPITADQLELHKSQVLERSHLSKEKLAMTIENLQNLQNNQNPLIKPETKDQIRESIVKLSEYFPNQFTTTQSSEEIDNAANDYFKKVFEAEPTQVDQKIAELIETMKRFRNSEVKKDQEIYACMLHSLFDEYRFLHKYPTPYLEKIAKLFGAVIKNRIMDGALQEIALKFVVEAFRREGKRMRFGIIVVRHIIDMLPLFPQFFESIYDQRNCINGVDAPLIREIEDLYERTMPKSPRTRAPSSGDSALEGEAAAALSQMYNSSIGSLNESFEDRKEEMAQPPPSVAGKGAQKGAKGRPIEQNPPQISNINQNDFFNAFQHNQTSAMGPTQSAPVTTQVKKEVPVKGGKAATVQQVQENPKTIPTSLPPSVSAPVFNPTYKVRNAGQSAQPAQPLDLAAQEAASIAQTGVGLNPSSVAFSRKANQPPNQLGISQTAPIPSTTPTSIYQPVPQAPSFVPPPILGATLSNPAGAANPLNFMNARPFRPQATRSPAPTLPPAAFLPGQGAFNQPPPPQIPMVPFNQQNYKLQSTIEEKLQRAISENVKVKLEDIIEDSLMAGPSQETQEDFKFICNNTGKNNFAQKLEQLKGHINQNPAVNLNWFIHFILTKRLGSLNLISLYIDMIKQIGQRDSITLTIAQAVEIFKKCMLVNEDQLNRVAHRAQTNASLIKQYLSNLGSFLGLLTVAGNRPLYAKELDVKQLLCESYQIEPSRTKYVITFVCRIMKECSKSTIFKYQNPWVKANLEILKEIYEYSAMGMQQQQPVQQEVLMEIDSLFKNFNIQNVNEVQHAGYLKACITSNPTNPAQQMELIHMMGKPKIIPSFQVLPVPVSQQEQQNYPPRPSMSPSPMGPNVFGGPSGIPFNQGDRMAPIQQQPEHLLMAASSTVSLITSHQKILEKVVISLDFLTFLNIPPGQLIPAQDQLLRKIVADAVEQSIVEILPPVVDRSVTIALITTRELVLKDFAFDPNPDKILKAADLIVQNLAGSLALVTCREPLKMQLTSNLKKSLQYQLDPLMFNQGEIQLPPLSDQLFTDLANLAGKDNLELGCKLIKKAVIQKAVTKVREDVQIGRAIEERQSMTSAEQFKAIALQDEAMIAQFVDLPQQLKPSPDGLTDAQFQVYEDFERLSNQGMGLGGPSGFGGPIATDYQGVAKQGGAGAQELSIDVSEDIETFLQQYEALPQFDKRFEQSLVAKLNFMNTNPDQQEQTKKLVKYCDNVFSSACERMVQAVHPGANLDKTYKILDLLQSILSVGLKTEELQSRLTSNFLALDGSKVNNAPLTLELMRRGILSAQKWDSQIATFIRESQQFGGGAQNVKELLAMLREFLEGATNSPSQSNMKEFSYQSFSSVMLVIQKMAEGDVSINSYFENILQDYRQRTVWTRDTLRDYFNEWATISFDEAANPQRQEQEVNRFFNNLRQQGLYKDPKAIFKFCKSMLELSIERALCNPVDGTKRPADRLVYRYIESFLNFLAVSLMQFSSNSSSVGAGSNEGIGKQELLMQVFEALFTVLDEDHKRSRADFNQKPYYRVFINLLRLISQSTIFNQKTHIHVLISLADLFIKLSPRDYPAFSFAWLELVSHKLFLPFFLNNQQAQQTPAGTTNAMNQPRRPAGAAQSNALPQGASSGDTLHITKWQKYKDVVLALFTFLKANMTVGQPMGVALTKYYEATLRVVLVIKNDYPEFLCDFHFNFVNSLPEHCIQLKNVILSATPRNIPNIDPFSKNLKVDTLNEINMAPRSQSNYENYLTIMNLREDLERYFRTRDKTVIQQIADKMMQSEEIVNGRKRINSHIFNAVALFIQNFAQQNKQRQTAAQKECYEMLKQIITTLSSETRLCLLNSIVNELRFINSHTYFYSWMIIYMFNDVDESVQEQISRILIERLQTHDPHPWGLCITFRELLQNPKYSFATKPFVQRNMAEIEHLMSTKLAPFYTYWQNNKQHAMANMQQQQHSESTNGQ